MFGPLAFLLGLALAAAAGQGEAGKTGIAWEGDYDAALEKAKKEGKPLFVSFTMDNEVANDETWQRIYPDPTIVSLSRKMVCLVGNINDHSPPGTPCTKFPAVTCEQHKEVEKKIRKAYITTDLVIAPQHVFCNPSGVEMFRKVWQISKDELRKAMAIAISGQSTTPPGADSSETHEIATAERARVDELLKAADSNNAEVRDPAFRELASADDLRAIPALLAKAKAGNDNSVRFSAIYALGVKGNYAAVKPLLGFLNERDTKISIYALNSLMQIELPDPVPDLLKLLARERNDRVRGYALRAVAKCHPGNPDVLKACLQALKGSSAQLEGPVLLALLSLKPDPKITAAVKPLLSAKVSNTRALAALVLGKQRDPSLLAILEKMVTDDKAEEVREIAPRAAAYCRGEEVPSYDMLGGRFCWDEELAEARWGSFGRRDPKNTGGPPR